ncbi:hypothetical protein HDU98_004637 [Podochytrium sp. JEL0797]|nr:hypothetical protein HDU98_004637 [Podochytrium sp. JEL0797]
MRIHADNSLSALLSSLCVLLFVGTLSVHAMPLDKVAPEGVQAKVKVANEKIWHLSRDNYKERLAHGTWLVFFGATWCKYSAALTPNWLEMQNEFYEFGMQKSGFMVSKVDCTGEQSGKYSFVRPLFLNKPVSHSFRKAEWCTEMFHIAYYPTINLYHNGSLVEEYHGCQKANSMLKYVQEKMDFYHPGFEMVKQDVDPQQENL